MARHKIEDFAIDRSRSFKRQNRKDKRALKSNSRNLEVAINLFNYVEDTPGMTRAILAKKLDVSQAYLSKVINGNVNLTLKTIEKYEEMLKVTLLPKMDKEEAAYQPMLLSIPQPKICTSEVYSFALDSASTLYSTKEFNHGNTVQICIY